MKNLFLLFFLLLCSLPLIGQTVVDVTQTQKIKEKGIELTAFNGKPLTGIITAAYSNGKPKSWINLKNGIADGLWQEWYSNGQLKFSANWLNGKGHGLWLYYHENGTLRQEEYYNLDIPIGIFRDFYDNGQLKTKSMWLNGKKHGVWSYYDTNGILIKTETYFDNEILSTTEN